MAADATDGACLAGLVKIAVTLSRAAQTQCPRTRPGRPPDFDDCTVAAVIMAAILARRK